MKRKNGRPSLHIILAVVLNAVAIYLVISSVVSSISQFNQSSFTQNVENIKTLTDASANKVSLVMDHYADNVATAAGYINYYHEVGMTELEAEAFISNYFGVADFSWQLIGSTSINKEEPTKESFDGIILSGGNDKFVSYRVTHYPALATVFSQASAKTLSQVRFVNEYTDASSLAKSFAVGCYVRIRSYNAAARENQYTYKTLMMAMKSAYINQIIASNNSINSLDFFDYTNVIIDEKGNYVFSNENFQGQNFLRYIEAYDDTFTKEVKEDLLKGLEEHTAQEPIFYKNNRGQDCIYTVSGVEDTDWYVLSAVPIQSFHNVDNYSGSYIRFFLSFMLLFLIDIVFILEINRKLRRTTREANAASLAKSQFLSSMSHDIRTPMNAIIGMTVIARENLQQPQPDRETLQDCVKTIELSGNHLLTLINDILDISKIESGRVALTADDFSISETMSRMMEIVQPQLKEKDLALETHIVNVNHEYIRADELRLNQIFINILSNAIKYTQPGGRITVDLCEEELPAAKEKIRLVYRVSDNGIGMDKEFQKTIFNRFTRAVDTRINRVQGTGLGMSIVKQLVDLMGGIITVESELNVGSVFTVTLDLPVAQVRSESISFQGLTALLIDDDPVLLETAEFALKKAGVAVESTTAGRDGIRMAEARQQEGKGYDVILVDWKMAEMSGGQVVRELRGRLGDGAKLMVMTAYNIADIDREARAAGANGFVTKPLFQSKLLRAIQSLYNAGSVEKAVQEHDTFALNVLVAEDNNINWKVIAKLLQRYGIQPQRAENGQKAVEMVQDSRELYDLVLMDIQMPVMNGYQATGAIRALADTARAATPIYAMTADAFAEDVARCLDKGMNGHLAKPIEVEKLVKLLRQVSEGLGK